MLMPKSKSSLELRESGDDTLVHDRANRKIHVLNRAAGVVLRACDGRTPIEKVVRAIDPGDSPAARRDVESVLADFAALGLIEA